MTGSDNAREHLAAPQADSAHRRRTSVWRRIDDRLEQAWQGLSEGLEVPDLWLQFKAETRAGLEHYSHEIAWEAIERLPRWRRPFRFGRILFWTLVKKLSPARRVILLLSLLLLGLAVLGIRPFGWPGSIQILLGVAGLLILLALELADRVAMKRDIEIAREIQGWLVPAAPPTVRGVDLAFTTRPANFVSGDYYDAFFRTDPAKPDGNKLLLVVADVVGKGVPAALVMASFQASLQALAPLPGTLDDLVAELNRFACSRNLRGLRFTTAFIAECDPKTGSLTYINAGHNAPFLRRASGSFERLEAGGLPLGIELSEGHTSGSAMLAPGDLLVVFTDGVIEALNEQGEEFGEGRLAELLQNIDSQQAGADSDQSAAALLNELMAGVDTFIGAARQRDDITCLVLRVV